jgi:predicted SprT family Zn-dependent metalloprotease
LCPNRVRRPHEMTDTAGLLPDWSRHARKWAELWGLPGLEAGIRVSFSARLTRSVGRCRAQTGEIVLHPSLRRASSRHRAAVLCHEFAHVAAYQLHGRVVRAHGPEWAALVAAAGFAPKTRSSLPRSITIRRTPVARTHTQLQVVHACPVCQTTRLARRAVPAWRCAECVRAGLEGRLVITRRTEVEE